MKYLKDVAGLMTKNQLTAVLLLSILRLTQAQTTASEADDLSFIEQLKAPQKNQQAAAPVSDWQAQLRYSYRRLNQQLGSFSQNQNAQQLAGEFNYQANWNPALRAQASATLLLTHPTQAERTSAQLVLKDAYLNWQSSASGPTELGLIAPRYGLAYGYNPNEVYRYYDERSANSADPQELREARGGVLAMRKKWFTSAADWDLLLLPRWHASQNQAGILRYPGRNAYRQIQLSVAPHLQNQESSLNANYLLRWQHAQDYAVGANLSALLSEASVWHLEVNLAKTRPACAEFLEFNPDLFINCEGQAKARLSLAMGANYSFNNKLTVLAEWHYDSQAPDRPDWQNWSQRTALNRSYFYEWLGKQQLLSSQHRVLLHARWDEIQPRWDVSAYLLHAPDSAQQNYWLQIKYRARQSDYSLQFLKTRGLDWNGAGPALKSAQWQFNWRWYL